MSEIKEKLFLAALEHLELVCSELRGNIKNESVDYSADISRFDDALEGTVETRNAYMNDLGVLIEDGIVNWDKSPAQLEEESED